MAQNVLGGELECCCADPITGFVRDGYCHRHPEDHGMHLLCALMTEEFLAFSRSRGNDLSTPRPEFGFPGLRAGDRWCLCVLRWAEAYEAGMAPQVVLAATHAMALEFVPMQALLAHAVDAPAREGEE